MSEYAEEELTDGEDDESDDDPMDDEETVSGDEDGAVGP